MASVCFISQVWQNRVAIHTSLLASASICVVGSLYRILVAWAIAYRAFLLRTISRQSDSGQALAAIVTTKLPTERGRVYYALRPLDSRAQPSKVTACEQASVFLVSSMWLWNRIPNVL